jgi:uncharacterized cupin superfamily protein
MPKIRIARLGETPVQTPWRELGALRTERFQAREERQLGRAVGINQFGVNHVTLGPDGYTSCAIGTRARTSSSSCCRAR